MRAAPDARIVYVDYDPVVLLHARTLLTSDVSGAIDYIDADLRDPGTICAGGGADAGLQPARWRSCSSPSCT